MRMRDVQGFNAVVLQYWFLIRLMSWMLVANGVLCSVLCSTGDGRSQDQSLVVSMEINGTLYQGVLFAQAPRGRFS